MPINLQPVWNELIKIYDEIAKVCDRHHLRYFVSAGTLLGAVRHQGFIPWDDDFDLHMPRPDYIRFCEIAPKELPDHLKIVDYHNTREYMFRFLKVQETDREVFRSISAESGYMNPHGLYVDIFPLDGRPDKFWETTWLKIKLFCAYARMTYLFRKGCHRGIKGYLGEYLGFIMGAFFGGIKTRKDWTCLYDQWSQKYDYEKCRLVGRFTDGVVRIGWNTRREAYSDFVDLPFGASTVKGPSGYEELLRLWYGDYMKLPPSEQQVSNHQVCEPAPWIYGPTGAE